MSDYRLRMTLERRQDKISYTTDASLILDLDGPSELLQGAKPTLENIRKVLIAYGYKVSAHPVQPRWDLPGV